MQEPLKFTSLPVVPDVGFWQELTRRKLDELKLDDSPLAIAGYFEVAAALGAPAKGFLLRESLAVGVARPTPPGSATLTGELKNFNTAEEFRDFLTGKTNSDRLIRVTAAAAQLREEILSGAALREPHRLRPLLLVSFADLKKYHYAHTAAMPVLTPTSPGGWMQVERVSTAEAAGFSRETLRALAVSFREDKELAGAGVCLLQKKQGGGWSVSPLKALTNTEDVGDLAVAFLDPSSAEDSPGWPLRNLLFLLAHHKPGRWRLLAFRDPQLASSSDSASSVPLRSRVFTVDAAKQLADAVLSVGEVPAEACVQGWSKVQNFDLTAFLDAKRVAADAVDLNIKLMKWRVLPQLEPDRMQRLRVLLLGAGTLGCSVARVLMGWGVRRMTFVDSGKVSYSNPVRQSLFTHRDAHEARPKALAAKEAVMAVMPDAEAEDVLLDIPMPGHPHQSLEALRAAVQKLQDLISSHDVVCMLTDSRESRWLPSFLIGAAQRAAEADQAPPLGLTVALGFDSFLVSRQTYRASAAACYFCNDVTAPADSLAFRTLDQQCTVTRPGLSGMASSVAVELLAALVQHSEGFAAPGAPSQEASSSSPLGIVPHQVRGYMSDFKLSPAETEPFPRCICCSEAVLKRYEESGMAFIEQVITNSSILEEISGLAAMKAGLREDEVVAFDDFDEPGEDDDST